MTRVPFPEAFVLVRKTNPTKQGLKHANRISIGFADFTSERLIQQNKD